MTAANREVVSITTRRLPDGTPVKVCLYRKKRKRRTPAKPKPSGGKRGT